MLEASPFRRQIAGVVLEKTGEIAAVVDAHAAGDDGNARRRLCKEHLFGLFYTEAGTPGAEIHAQFLKAVLVELGRIDAHLLGAA